MDCNCKHTASDFLIKFLKKLDLDFEECDNGLSFWIDDYMIVFNKKTEQIEVINED